MISETTFYHGQPWHPWICVVYSSGAHIVFKEGIKCLFQNIHLFILLIQQFILGGGVVILFSHDCYLHNQVDCCNWKQEQCRTQKAGWLVGTLMNFR